MLYCLPFQELVAVDVEEEEEDRPFEPALVEAGGMKRGPYSLGPHTTLVSEPINWKGILTYCSAL
jgi:hypothetical protein